MSSVMSLTSADLTTVIGGSFWSFDEARGVLAKYLLETEPFNAGKWQQLDVSASDIHATYELRNVTLSIPVPNQRTRWKEAIEPDMPWAEDHFQERVGGSPVNPGTTHEYWPYHGLGASLHLRGKIYDHNYMERFWPKEANTRRDATGKQARGWRKLNDQSMGYRFPIGDLGNVVEQLRRDPLTRQAYLPVWFPEDTGATEGQRVPCSLGYHFLQRDGRLHMQYNLRSCEIYRHFTNDVYLAGRLLQWVADSVGSVPGTLTLHAVSFHGFVGDRIKIEEFL